MIDYTVSISLNGGSYSIYLSGVTDTTITAVSLTKGVTYGFKVQSRTIYGLSEYSEELLLLSAIAPYAPPAPTTTVDGGHVVIEWGSPAANGSPITGYEIYIKSSTGAFVQESLECDGTSAIVYQNRICYIQLTTLIVAPFNLVQDDSIAAKIIAKNAYGDSPLSAEGAGGIIKVVPDSPVNLQNDGSTTDDIKIRFTWEEGAHDGGTPVIDYSIYYDEGLGDGTRNLLEANVVPTEY